MKAIMALIVATGLCSACFSQVSVLYGTNISGTNSKSYSISSYKGQKIMIVVLPSTHTATDSAFLKRIDSVSVAHKGQLKTIAVPSLDDGYVTDTANTLLKFYQASIDSSIIVSQPVHTHRASVLQNGLFSWLTHSSQNVHFDYDVSGPGMMFFINEQGGLYGVFGPEAMFSDKVLNIAFQ